MAIEWTQKQPEYSIAQPSRRVFECVISYAEWASGHAAKTTGNPLDLRGFKRVNVTYINNFSGSTVSVTPTPATYVEADETWHDLPALEAESLAPAATLERMLKPIAQSPSAGDALCGAMGVTFSVDPSMQPLRGSFTIVVECFPE